jgi:hypothetical protein
VGYASVSTQWGTCANMLGNCQSLLLFPDWFRPGTSLPGWTAVKQKGWRPPVPHTSHTSFEAVQEIGWETAHSAVPRQKREIQVPSSFHLVKAGFVALLTGCCTGSWGPNFPVGKQPFILIYLLLLLFHVLRRLYMEALERTRFRFPRPSGSRNNRHVPYAMGPKPCFLFHHPCGLQRSVFSNLEPRASFTPPLKRPEPATEISNPAGRVYS